MRKGARGRGERKEKGREEENEGKKRRNVV